VVGAGGCVGATLEADELLLAGADELLLTATDELLDDATGAFVGSTVGEAQPASTSTAATTSMNKTINLRIRFFSSLI
jgi:hypothetical protein